ncbi:hypothetical protein SO802_007004 [Lithocarpus litseifolius]|uniref:Uncharacterized protein n=1 Tax=Lithocarpus litseifolius TaxID=425828 RepID=A0AAW2DSF5_9ROSI
MESTNRLRGGVFASGKFGDGGVDEMSSGLGLEAVEGEIKGRREKARSTFEGRRGERRSASGRRRVGG